MEQNKRRIRIIKKIIEIIKIAATVYAAIKKK